MISIVCVYNDRKILDKYLLKSLEKQTVESESIIFNVEKRNFKSASQALNYGGESASGDYIVFADQGIWMNSESWLEDAENILQSIQNLGVAGISGESEIVEFGGIRSKWAINNFFWDLRGLVKKPEEIQTLNEILLIVPKKIFNKIKFDESNFDGWWCYGADYCLSVKKHLGLKSYVIPLQSNYYGTMGSKKDKIVFNEQQKYQKRLYSKHKDFYPNIYTWMGKISVPVICEQKLARVISPISSKIFRDLPFYLKRELNGNNSVLDLGCGPYSPISVCKIPYSVGVELFEPYIEESKRCGIHNHYRCSDVMDVEFKNKSFDAAVALEVIEHLSKKDGLVLLEKMERWAKKKVLITTPNGYHHQEAYNENPLQEHKSSWCVKDFKELGYKVRGLHGWKSLRGEKALLKYKPEFFWNLVSDISQQIVYNNPRNAFQILATKDI